MHDLPDDLAAEDTSAIALEAIEDERASGMAEEMIQREIYCSFASSLVGSYYGPQMTQSRHIWTRGRRCISLCMLIVQNIRQAIPRPSLSRGMKVNAVRTLP